MKTIIIRKLLPSHSYYNYLRAVRTSAAGIHVSKRIINIRPSAHGALCCYAVAISRVLSHVWHTGGKVYVPQIQ